MVTCGRYSGCGLCNPAYHPRIHVAGQCCSKHFALSIATMYVRTYIVCTTHSMSSVCSSPVASSTLVLRSPACAKKYGMAWVWGYHHVLLGLMVFTSSISRGVVPWKLSGWEDVHYYASEQKWQCVILALDGSAFPFWPSWWLLLLAVVVQIYTCRSTLWPCYTRQGLQCLVCGGKNCSFCCCCCCNSFWIRSVVKERTSGSLPYLSPSLSLLAYFMPAKASSTAVHVCMSHIDRFRDQSTWLIICCMQLVSFQERKSF